MRASVDLWSIHLVFFFFFFYSTSPGLCNVCGTFIELVFLVLLLQPHVAVIFPRFLTIISL